MTSCPDPSCFPRMTTTLRLIVVVWGAGKSGTYIIFTCSWKVSLLLQDCCSGWNRYEEANVESLSNVRRYSADVPECLHNRPVMFVKHCMARLPPSAVLIPQQDIVQSGNGVFTMKSQSTPTKLYSVRFQTDSNANVPTCDCIDWQRHHLPCKHLLAILLTAGLDNFPYKSENSPNIITSCLCYCYLLKYWFYVKLHFLQTVSYSITS